MPTDEAYCVVHPDKIIKYDDLAILQTTTER